MEDTDLKLALPIPHFDSALTMLYMLGFAVMLALIDVIEQVMSNAAIEKIDPLKRKCNSNNSLFAIWIANMGSSFFGGMTNLDGLAKSTTNRLAGAYTKFSVLIIGCVVTFFTFNTHSLEYLPKFALAVIHDLLRLENDRGTRACDPSWPLCYDPCHFMRRPGL
jgi:MFS superfamily sulfate permease-like transporter